MDSMDEVVYNIPKDMLDVKTTTANRILILPNKTRELREIIANYDKRASKLRNAIDSWRTKHSELEHLIPDSPSDEYDLDPLYLGI